jgi:hypothetical protein
MSMMVSVRPRCDTRPRGPLTFFCCVRFLQDATRDFVPAIQFIVRLCWLRVDLCVGGKVTRAVVAIVRSLLKFIGAFLLQLTHGAIHRYLYDYAIEWHNSDDDWAIDGAHCLVSRGVARVQHMLDVRSPAIGPCFRRNLNNNQLTGTISSTIGQLTALTAL